MNRYQDMMDKVPIPAGQAERLKAAVLAAGPKGKRRIYRPRSFAKKVLLAALIAAALLTATVGAAVASVNWDRIFTENFGEDAAATDMAAEMFQEVGVTSVCDDVTLTVRETVGDGHTIYIILDYQLPDTVDQETLEERWQEVHTASIWGTHCVLTDAVTWEDIRGQNFEEAWKSARKSAKDVWAGASGGGTVRGYDPETNTLTWLERTTLRQPLELTDQSLTIVMDVLMLGDEPLTDHPAIITFQPVNNARVISGVYEDGETGVSFRVSLSPLALLVKAHGDRHKEFGGIPKETALIFKDGTAVPVVELACFGGTSSGSDMVGVPESNTNLQFEELLDITDIRAVRIGDLEIPLS